MKSTTPQSVPVYQNVKCEDLSLMPSLTDGLSDYREFIAEFVDELIENDYRKEGTVGSPLECFHPETDHWQNPAYITSVTCPLAALYKLNYS